MNPLAVLRPGQFSQRFGFLVFAAQWVSQLSPR